MFGCKYLNKKESALQWNMHKNNKNIQTEAGTI